MRLIMFATGILVLCPALSAQESETPSSEMPSHEIWQGGIGCLDDDRFAWREATLELPRQGSERSGNKERRGKLRSEANRRYSLRIQPLDELGNVKVIVRRRRVDREFTGTLQEGILTANCDDGEIPNRMNLRRIAFVPDTRLDELAGMYTIAEDHRISFRRQGRGLSMTDYKTGQVRRCYPVNDELCVAGPAIAVPDPVEFRIRFRRNASQRVKGVTISTSDDVISAARCADAMVEDIVYASFDGTRIAGSLFKPPGEGPFPAVVIVHGSGRATRDRVGSWPLYYTDLGFAVFAVDKRGCGKSEGQYRLPDGGGSDNFPHMRRRSRDVAAAVEMLGDRDDILGDKIGLSGGSQAGWVIPMAADKAHVAFAIILSGGATPLSFETKYSFMAAEDSSGSQLPPVDELIAQLRRHQPADPGIDSELAAMEFPALWLYGYKDRSNPSQICEEWISRIGDQYERDFTIRTFPDGNHGLLVSRFGGSAEYRALKQVVPDLYPGIKRWLTEKHLLPKKK